MTEKRGGKKICKRKICKKKMRSLMLCLILAAASAGCGVKAPGSAGESGAGLSGAEVSGAAKSEAGASGAGKSAEDASGTDTSGGGTSEAGAFGAEPSAAGIPEAAGDRDIGAAVQDFGLRLLQSCLESQKFPPYASLPEHVYDALEEGGNVLVSPLSIVSALTMTANGARGDTLDQMETALGMSAQELDAFFQDYERVFTFGEKCRLSMADSIWFTADERFTLEEEFLKTNEEYFGASFFREPFDASTAARINAWVEENTDGLIRKIVDVIPEEEAVMYLVNALAFDGEWKEIYESDQVTEGNFTKEDGTVQKADMMYSAEERYLKGDRAEGFLKYYADERYAFAALLPEEGVTLAEYVSALTGEELGKILEQAEKIQVQVSIPKFRAEYGITLNSALQEMGIRDAFDEYAADFTELGSSDRGSIFIGRVLHKTFVAVDERGTKAGAATAVEMHDKLAVYFGPESRTVYLDRPFVYMIIDCETGVPLFIGTVADLGTDS